MRKTIACIFTAVAAVIALAECTSSAASPYAEDLAIQKQMIAAGQEPSPS